VFHHEVEGTGLLELGAAGTLSVTQGAAAGQLVDFMASSGLLQLDHPFTFKGAIEGFGAGDRIELQQTMANKLVYANNVLTVKEGNSIVASLHFDGSYNSASFTLTSDGHGNSVITVG
jgi:hypothetical protein